MNNFQSVQSAQGLLKQVYDPPSTSPTEEALRKRRQKMSAKIESETNDETQISGG